MHKIYKGAIIVAICVMFINFLFTVGIGVYKTFHAFMVLADQGTQGKPGLEIVESLDLFLVGLVFLIVSLGFMKLFHPEFSWFKDFNLPWLKVDDFFQLKQLIWNAFLLTLLVTFGIQLLRTIGDWNWTLLVVPGSVLLFALAAKFMKH